MGQHVSSPYPTSVKCGSHSVPNNFPISSKIIRLLTPDKWGPPLSCEIERADM